MTRTPTTRVLDALHSDRFADAHAVKRRARVTDEQWTQAVAVLSRLRLVEVCALTVGRRGNGQRGTRGLTQRVYRRVAA